MKWAGALRFFRRVLIVDAIVVAGAIVLAVAGGAFNRSAIGFFMLVAGGVMAFAGAIAAGGLPFIGVSQGASSGMNYANALHTEMLLQQSMRDGHQLGVSSRRRRISAVLVVAGLSLLVAAMFVIG